jgi:magnesium-transporting ATPase (P-type)
MTAKEHTYLSTTESGAVVAIKDFFAYFVLLSFFIPSSMMVTLEIVRVVQSKLMEWDEEMYANKNDPHSGMIAKTSNLNDELALVKYIFSDKTGNYFYSFS